LWAQTSHIQSGVDLVEQSDHSTRTKHPTGLGGGRLSMDKLFETLLKYLPSELIPCSIALVVAFFGVYFFKGFRNYTDAINDKTFITLAVVICATFIIYQIQKPATPTIAADVRPLLLVPDFEDDERRQFKTVFIQQLQAFIGKLHKDAAIIPVAAHITDKAAAKLTGKSYNAIAALYQPKVIRLDDKKTVLCFSLLLLDIDVNKAYPPLPAEIEKNILEDMTALLLGPLSAKQEQNDPVFARIDALERKVDQLTAAVFKTNALVQAPTERKYGTKRALLIGVNFEQSRKIPPLQYAASDAQAMDAVLKKLGFVTTILVNETATQMQVRSEIDKLISASKADDLLLIYYAGNSIRSTDLRSDQPKALILNTFDLKLGNPLGNLTLNAVVEKLNPVTNAHRLIIIDGCHGTYGLPIPSTPISPQVKASTGRTFQVITGTQDDEYGLEVAGGGLFTKLLTSKLQDAASGNRRLSTNELLGATSAELGGRSGGGQRPKILTLSGTEDVVF